MAEVQFQPLAWIVRQRNERHLVPLSMDGHIPPDLIVTTPITVRLPLQPAEDLHGRVPLLTRGLLVLGQDLVDHRLERPQLGRFPLLRQGVPPGLRIG